MKIAIFCKAQPGAHHHYRRGGLTTNAEHTVAVLGTMGVEAEVRHVSGYAELLQAVTPDLSMAVVEALWLTTEQAEALAHLYPDTTIVVRAHSKMGFLQVEPEAIPQLRGIATTKVPNLRLSSNNEEFCRAVGEVYGPCLHLPNLYDSASAPRNQRRAGPELNIASFGATRLLKLHPNAALAALQIARRMGRPLAFHINSDGTPGGDSVRRTIANVFEGLPDAHLVQLGWQEPAEFRGTIAQMDLVLQASCTETFCMVAADAVSSRVPVVAGPAVSWLPPMWQAPIDDTSTTAAIGVLALQSYQQTVAEQAAALDRFTSRAKKVWAKELGIRLKRWWQFGR